MYLKGAAVVTTGKIVGFQEGILICVEKELNTHLSQKQIT